MDKKKLIKKFNGLIESRCNLNLNQQKLVLAVVSKINREDEDFKEYRLSISEFKSLMGLKGAGGYTEIRKEAREIKRKDLVINLGDDGELITSWFSDIEIRYKGEVGFYISAKLKPFLLQLKSNFTAYQLKNILKLNSKYSIRLFELLKQYEGIGCRRFELGELKKMLYVKPQKYTRFNNFKARILESSITDINANTDIRIDYTLHKTGRIFTAVEFCISKQDQKELFSPTENTPPTSITDLIPQESRNSCQKLCQQIFTKDGTDGLKFYIGKCNSRKQMPNGSYSGYLKTVFELDLYADIKEARKGKIVAEKAQHEAEKKLWKLRKNRRCKSRSSKQC